MPNERVETMVLLSGRNVYLLLKKSSPVRAGKT
jgi:hypothetical protein